MCEMCAFTSCHCMWPRPKRQHGGHRFVVGHRQPNPKLLVGQPQAGHLFMASWFEGVCVLSQWAATAGDLQYPPLLPWFVFDVHWSCIPRLLWFDGWRHWCDGGEFLLSVARELLACVLGTIKICFLTFLVSDSHHITRDCASSGALIANTSPNAQASYRG